MCATITSPPGLARSAPEIKKGAWSEPYATCATPSGPAACFTTLAECNRQALLWRDEVAHQRRWPGGDNRTVAEAFAEEQPRLLPPRLHPFPTDRIVPVRSRKTIYVRFDLNDYSIPPEAVGRQLTLAASDTTVRILDGSAEIARHVRSYDRHQLVDPAHQDAVLVLKRKAFHSTPGGRLEQAVPESRQLLDLAFAQGESAGSQTAQLMKLLEHHGAAALRRAIREALERNTPRASSVAFLLRRQRDAPHRGVRPQPPSSGQSLDVRPQDLETYDELARHTNDNEEPDAITSPRNSVRSACARSHATGRLSCARHQSPLVCRQLLEEMAQAEIAERSRRSLERRLRLCGIKSFKPMADFDWSWPSQIERDVIERALTLDSLSEARNLVLVGSNGLGKTMIAQNICHAPCWPAIRCSSFRCRTARRSATANAGRPPPQAPRLCQCRTACASMKSGISPSTTKPPTCSTKSSTGATNANP